MQKNDNTTNRLDGEAVRHLVSAHADGQTPAGGRTPLVPVSPAFRASTTAPDATGSWPTRPNDAKIGEFCLKNGYQEIVRERLLKMPDGFVELIENDLRYLSLRDSHDHDSHRVAELLLERSRNCTPEDLAAHCAASVPRALSLDITIMYSVKVSAPPDDHQKC